MIATATPRVALSKDFLDAYSRLPKGIQKKVREFTEKFRQDPKSPGINYETLQVRDDKVRSVRIGIDYRAIVIHPPKDDVYLCVWVDHHDEAYQWAKNRVFEVNPSSGSLQLYEVEEGAPAVSAPLPVAPATYEAPKLFSEVSDEDLLLAGVPRPLLVSVRTLVTDHDLDDLAPHLPEEAAEMLYALASGFSLWDALEQVERSKTVAPKVDVEDFEAALALPGSQRTFKILEDDADLARMLDAPLEQWRIFLHPTQRKLVRMKANGPARVLGGAGTGKTVVLLHRARYLAAEVFTGPDDRILVTTYSKNLALDLRTHLRRLCGDEFARIEVINLHAFARDLLYREGVKCEPIFDSERSNLFTRASGDAGDDSFTSSFYREEWDRVIQPQEITDRDAYFSARRTGRGTRLSRKQRALAWEVLQLYREMLEDAGKMEWADIVREARMLIERQGRQMAYRAVLADEVQDFGAGDLKLLRALLPPGPGDLFLVGDGHQRIYGRPIRLSVCGIDIRGRSRRLRLNYRTTEQIRARAIAVLEGCTVDDLDGEADSVAGYCSLRSGPRPRVLCFDSEAEEAEAVLAQVRAWIEEGVPTSHICVAARTNKLIQDRYEPMLENAGIETVTVKTDPDGEAAQEGVRLATMHRLKGLEFPRVLLASVHKGTVPDEYALRNASDDAEREDMEVQERSLLYVACTRARDDLVITGFGEPSSLLAVEGDGDPQQARDARESQKNP